MKERAAALIASIEQGNGTQSDIDTFVLEAREAIKADPQRGKEYGQYINQVAASFRSQPAKLTINWVNAGGGFLAIGHKPGGKLPFDGMKLAGTDLILTLLQENEGAEKIGAATKKAGISWTWFPFSASRPHEGDAIPAVFALFEDLKQDLGKGKKIYIHCSAGIHRTGMISYALLRYIGYDAATAAGLLRSLREVTAEQVGEERLQWSEQFANAPR